MMMRIMMMVMMMMVMTAMMMHKGWRGWGTREDDGGYFIVLSEGPDKEASEVEGVDELTQRLA